MFGLVMDVESTFRLTEPRSVQHENNEHTIVAAFYVVAVCAKGWTSDQDETFCLDNKQAERKKAIHRIDLTTRPG